MIDVIESAAYDAKSSNIRSLGLPNDEMVMKHFIELRKITKKLNRLSRTNKFSSK